MTPQERDLIASLLSRLQQAANQPKDRDAEALIRQGITAQPDAPYLLVQTVLIEDMALSEAHNRIKDLEQQLAAAQSAPQQQPTSFLGAARSSVPAAGPWGRPAPAAAPGPVWTQGGAPQQAAPAPSMVPAMAPLAAPSASSGFLRQAATTAAGVAGGALLFEGISSMFGPHYGNMLGGMPAQPGIGETVINNYYGDGTPGNANDPGLSQASDQDPGYQDPGGQDYAADQDVGTDQDFGGQDSGGGSFDV